MASLADLCWTLSEDLFTDVDLDVLYLRQLKTMGAENCDRYPYQVLLHTGKITIGIDLGHQFDRPHRGFSPGDAPGMDLVSSLFRRPIEDPSE